MLQWSQFDREQTQLCEEMLFFYTVWEVCVCAVCPRYALFNCQRLCWCPVASPWTLQLLCKLSVTWLMARLKHTSVFFKAILFLMYFLNSFLIVFCNTLNPHFCLFLNPVISSFYPTCFCLRWDVLGEALSRVLKLSYVISQKIPFVVLRPINTKKKKTSSNYILNKHLVWFVHVRAAGLQPNLRVCLGYKRTSGGNEHK